MCFWAVLLFPVPSATNERSSTAHPINPSSHSQSLAHAAYTSNLASNHKAINMRFPKSPPAAHTRKQKHRAERAPHGAVEYTEPPNYDTIPLVTSVQTTNKRVPADAAEAEAQPVNRNNIQPVINGPIVALPYATPAEERARSMKACVFFLALVSLAVIIMGLVVGVITYKGD